MTAIPFSHAPNGVGYKLLELPSELVELLEGENPPVLTLTPSPTAALLKTPTKTYSLRQNNTSNALILLSTNIRTHDGNQTEGGEVSDPSVSLAAIATVHETIELISLGAGESVPVAKARGKWHEKFGRTR
ncbi:hypothetical protein B0H66DRAFT_558657 [Apodospora peruviana]|uniref:Uncharacterized protein n=1 Tax=Apodospora peruviana TaxID=516989 RepID=A0AAE0M4L4_9PEZI|nr:hypothetical protein B0H66DRAFT_558657 [Apodospora peruviana]